MKTQQTDIKIDREKLFARIAESRLKSIKQDNNGQLFKGVQTQKNDSTIMNGLICHQIQFYFSSVNLCTDPFLYKLIKQSERHYVDIDVFRKFKKIQEILKKYLPAWISTKRQLYHLRQALELSDQLKVNQEDFQVKRRKPFNFKSQSKRTFYIEAAEITTEMLDKILKSVSNDMKNISIKKGETGFFVNFESISADCINKYKSEIEEQIQAFPTLRVISFNKIYQKESKAKINQKQQNQKSQSSELESNHSEEKHHKSFNSNKYERMINHVRYSNNKKQKLEKKDFSKSGLSPHKQQKNEKIKLSSCFQSVQERVEEDSFSEVSSMKRNHPKQPLPGEILEKKRH